MKDPVFGFERDPDAWVDDQDLEAAEAEAIRRFQAGESYGVSTGICDQTTYGYGRLSTLGYWEFPLYLDPENPDELRTPS